MQIPSVGKLDASVLRRERRLAASTHSVARLEGGECLCRSRGPVSAAIVKLWRTRGAPHRPRGQTDRARLPRHPQGCRAGPASPERTCGMRETPTPPARKGLGRPGGPQTPCPGHGDPEREHGNQRGLLTEAHPERSSQAVPPEPGPEEVPPGRSRTRRPPMSGRR